MFRSSVAAFYAWLLCLFYSFTGCGRRSRFIKFRRLLRVDSEVEKIVHWMPEILFAAEIAQCAAAHLRYLDANLAIKEEILAKTTPINTKGGRYRPDDDLLAFLKGL